MTRRTLSSKARQLASLTSVGAGAIALTGSVIALTPTNAEAGIIQSGILNQRIGFNSTVNAATDARAVNAHFTFKTFAASRSGPSIKLSAVSFRMSANHVNRFIRGAYQPLLQTQFAVSAVSRLAVIPFGHSWSSRGASNSVGFASRRWGNGSTFNAGASSFSDQYYLFNFQPKTGPNTLEFGWIELSMSVNGACDDSAANCGPNVDVIRYAFNNAASQSGNAGGVNIAAGVAPAPEPSSLAESALAALILGAEGLRRWRKARRPA